LATFVADSTTEIPIDTKTPFFYVSNNHRSAGQECNTTMSSSEGMSYSGYLGLDKILNAQQPLSTAHDEILFIIQHQTSELWMKLAIHELSVTCQLIAADNLQPAFKTLSRVSRILEQLNSAWDVLRTMTPSEYTQFREALGKSSGFQSYQYRLIEFLAGNKNAAMMRVHAHDKTVMARLEAVRQAPSIYDLTIQLLYRRGLPIDRAVIERDVSASHTADDSVRAAWLAVYRDPSRFWELYELAEKLVDFEDYFRRWRFNHVTTVERVIGFKRGTGGTSGVSYLRSMLDVVLFPELWQARTEL
jgi:tryptophan 2,3-dioxygenase